MATLTAAAVSPRLADAAANRMLAAVSPDGLETLLAQALVLEVEPGDLLYGPQQTAPWVFFPLSCVVSIMTVLQDGSAVETVTIGREGMVGTFQALGDDHNPNGRAVIQMGGRLLRVDASVFRRELQRNPLLAEAIEAYLRAMLIHISQSVACGAAHSVKERLARWLLQTSDRVASDDVRLTHEFLAHILHVRRASVTVALGELQDVGLVSTRRGGTRVLDRDGLAGQACECYALVNEEYARLDPRRTADRVVSDRPAMSEPERRRRHPVLPNAGQLDVPPEARPPVEGELRAEVKADRGKILLRLAFLVVTLIALYILWPSLLTVLESWPDLLTLDPLWFVAMLALEFASFVCIWGLQRLSLRTQRWFAVATAQLAANAFSRVVPGGAAAGGALQYRMLTEAGELPTTVGTGLTAASLISTGTLFMLPLLVVPAVIAGRPTPSGLAQAAWLGGVVFVVGFFVGWLLITHDRALLATARGIQRVRNLLVRKGPRTTDLPERLLVERNEIRHSLGAAWWKALLFALGNWLFDYLALLAALAAVGSFPRPSLVLLAYSASMVLAMIPITPGGLGFVEAGLTGLLALAGVNAGDAVLATLAYRMVSFWLPLPAGGVAALLHRRRYGHRSEGVVA